MKRSIFILLAALFFCDALTLFAVEPEYDGKKFGSWVKEFRETGNVENRQRARDAIRQIGTNALPFLLEETMDLGDAWKADLTNFVNSAALLDRLMNVRAGFEALGGHAKPAFNTWADLMKSNGTYANIAAYALTQMDPKQAATAFAGIIKTNQSYLIRWVAIAHLFHVGTNAVVAVPSLLSCLDENRDSQEARNLRRLAVSTLGDIAQHSDVVVPRLAEKLKADEFWAVRAAAAKSLGAFSNAAQSALPALRSASTNDTNFRVRAVSTNAIMGIEATLSAPTGN